MRRTLDIARLAADLALQGQPFVLATVVRAEAPASVRPGAKAIVYADGRVEGWIGGSCSEPNVVRHARHALLTGETELLRIGPEDLLSPTGVTSLTTTCPSGGTVDIFLEPVQPSPQLVVIGHTPVAHAVASIGEAIGHRVVLIDGRAGLDVAAIEPGANVVVASMGHYDEDALVAALAFQPATLALIASRKRARAALDLLRERGVSDELIATIDTRPGLELGEVTQEEIALAVVAGIVQRTRAVLEEGPRTAIDPTSGSEILVDETTPSAEYQGATYYFSCNGCKGRFLDDPAKFVGTLA
ncbi:MAG: YHS domain-containing protein [Thermoleophilia bacterium]|nr:YHS domain-containing protein [Thermoleophilia bacterium]